MTARERGMEALLSLEAVSCKSLGIPPKAGLGGQGHLAGAGEMWAHRLLMVAAVLSLGEECEGGVAANGTQGIMDC